jgi:hypothetical protein
MCALCQREAPAWWYVIEPDVDAHGRLVDPVAFARWWAIGMHCSRLISQDPDALSARVEAAAKNVDESRSILELLPTFVQYARPLRAIAP